MELFWKAVAAVLLASILGLTISRQEKDLSVLLTIAACCFGTVAAVTLLQPVLDMLQQLETLAQVSDDMLRILLKCVGLSLVTEMTASICQDSGSSSLGKTLQMLGTATILYLSSPLFTDVISLIQEILYHL